LLAAFPRLPHGLPLTSDSLRFGFMRFAASPPGRGEGPGPAAGVGEDGALAGGIPPAAARPNPQNWSSSPTPAAGPGPSPRRLHCLLGPWGSAPSKQQCVAVERPGEITRRPSSLGQVNAARRGVGTSPHPKPSMSAQGAGVLNQDIIRFAGGKDNGARGLSGTRRNRRVAGRGSIGFRCDSMLRGGALGPHHTPSPQ
jgi:hypothetical protein